MPCLGAATQNNPVRKAFYDRLIAKGKEPKVALVACMRKLIVIFNTMTSPRPPRAWPPRLDPIISCGMIFARVGGPFNS
jgi:transposase